jgi:HEAT repeat protein
MAAYLTLVTNEDARVRAFAIGQSGGFSRSFHQFPEVTAQIQKCQTDPDYEVRVAATNALGSTNGPTPTQKL